MGLSSSFILLGLNTQLYHYRRIYAEFPKPVVFIPEATSTSGRIIEEFWCLLYLHVNREDGTLVGALSEESDQFRFLRAACLANLKGSIGLMLDKASVMRVTIPLDLSTRSFIPLPRFIHTRNTTPLRTPSLLLFPHSSA